MPQWEKIIGGGGKRSPRDFYSTPADVTDALLRWLRQNMMLMPGDCVWDPACGDGAMLHEFARHGLRSVGTDIREGQDFLQAQLPVESVSWIITNPPFSLAEEFIFKAQSLEVPFAYLLKSQFWHAGRRRDLFRSARPAMVLPLTWRPDFTGRGASLMDFVWVVWFGRPLVTIYEPLTREK